MTFEAVAVWKKRIANEILTNFQFKFTPLGRTKLPHPLFFLNSILINSSIIRQKGEYQTEGNKKTKHAKFSEKQTFLTPWYAHVRACKKFSIFRKIWDVLISC